MLWRVRSFAREKRFGRAVVLAGVVAEVVAGLLWASTALAGGGPATDAYEGIGERAVEAHLFADLYLQHDFNSPQSALVQLRAFDFVDGPSVGLLGVTLARRPRTVGFRIDAGVGDLATGYYNDDPLSRSDPDLALWLSRVQQAFLTVVAPVGRGLQIDAGKYDTPIGFEDNRSFTNWNYSRSLLFTFAEPSVHLGLRATYPFTDTTAVSVFWNNGWNTNGGVDFGGLAAYATVAATDWLRASVRGEWLADPEGYATGTPQTVGEVTATLEGHAEVHRLSLAIRLEYRHDHSTAPVFQQDDGSRFYQDTITVALLASY
jgi:hypothetical protein